ncbi:uncharacterized protein UBRO_04655 [Ustilago bromivora]|uniref:Related to SWI/SNF related, matrix associated, actin dependent regulator of chromatin subfamily D member 1 n=1 Tax=Ustilago bromivora TaxID=307758 RepID=A0A1K0G4K2_9BASI|nr:uncharacterized protein UBRO_04655 [Ustilago bromivora]SYW79396.1 related to SWI/SNF related, matrix associated, actin dependent regulator of chromatin subfamily D member 1 [Ustilago bromivora]
MSQTQDPDSEASPKPLHPSNPPFHPAASTSTSAHPTFTSTPLPSAAHQPSPLDHSRPPSQQQQLDQFSRECSSSLSPAPSTPAAEPSPRLHETTPQTRPPRCSTKSVRSSSRSSTASRRANPYSTATASDSASSSFPARPVPSHLASGYNRAPLPGSPLALHRPQLHHQQSPQPHFHGSFPPHHDAAYPFDGSPRDQPYPRGSTPAVVHHPSHISPGALDHHYPYAPYQQAHRRSPVYIALPQPAPAGPYNAFSPHPSGHSFPQRVTASQHPASQFAPASPRLGPNPARAVPSPPYHNYNREHPQLRQAPSYQLYSQHHQYHSASSAPRFAHVPLAMDNPAHMAQAQAQAQTQAQAQAHAQMQMQMQMQMAQVQAQAQAQQQAQNLRRKNAQDVLVGQGFRGLKRGRPTDRSLPPSLKRQVPESAFYSDLQRMEKNLDWTVARKRAELTDGLLRPPKIKRTLRIFLSNTCANQPFQLAEKQKAKESGANAAAASAETGEAGDVKAEGATDSGDGKEEDAVPSWTLRIEGRLLEPSFKSRANTALSAQASINRTGAHKFSNLIKTCVVELMRDPALYPDGSNIVEWHRPVPSIAPASGMQAGGGAGGLGGTQGMEAPLVASAEPALDGFEIKRKGNVPTKVKIVLYPAYTPDRYSLAPELATLLDIREESRAGVISALWSYVKEKKLLDETDRKKVKCDAALRSLFNTDTINFHHIPEVINRYLHPAQPIVIEYWVRTDKAEYKHSTAYDIELDLEDLAIRQKQHNVLSQFDAANDAISREIAELDDKIAQATATIRNRASARDFLAAFAKDPQGHLRTWIASQARDLDAILGNNPVPGAGGSVSNFTAEEMRRAETFRGAWVDEAVIVNEAQRLAEKLQELQSQAAQPQPGQPGA